MLIYYGTLLSSLHFITCLIFVIFGKYRISMFSLRNVSLQVLGLVLVYKSYILNFIFQLHPFLPQNRTQPVTVFSIQTYVTLDRVMEHIIMRGLSRVWITLHMERILLYLTLKGHINTGVISPPTNTPFIQPLNQNQEVR